MHRLMLMIIVVPAVSFFAGCAAELVVRRPDGSRGGIPFYPAKPYLVVTKNIDLAFIPATNAATSQPTNKEPQGVSVTDFMKNIYRAQLMLLPDLGQKHELNVKPNNGKYEFSANLEDGWRLTSVKLSADDKAAETIESIAKVIDALSPAFTPAAPAAGGTNMNDVLVEIIKGVAQAQLTENFAGANDSCSDPKIWLYEFDIIDGTLAIRLVDVDPTTAKAPSWHP